MSKAIDQTFGTYGAKLITDAAPYDPFSKRGDETDPAYYIAVPGINFLRPWLAIRNGPAFQWPLGLQGYTLSIDPTLGIHKFIGDNKVVVEIIHAGEEHFTMTGQFPGTSASELIQALRQVVYQDTPGEGKILYVPDILSHAQRVAIVHAEFSRAEDDRGDDANYSIEFVRLGLANENKEEDAIPSVPNDGGSNRTVKVDGKHNTLRKIALWKLKSGTKWRTLYNLNSKWFRDRKIPMTKIPDYRIPVGTVIYY